MVEQGRDQGIRISAAERDEAVRLLAAHLATGRLELDEYEFRCVRAGAARTRSELEALFTDLPAPHPDMSAARSPLRAVRDAAGKSGRTPPDGLLATPLSEALGTLCALTLVLGIPGAIVLTAFTGAWWTIVATVLVTIAAGTLESAARRRP
ncbi:DUF1707 SHOCT-like domain-containing protein [Actinokineospora bangkokensis]|uniref:DUF1707 domain-containing protein n=1 Tax=Actinokineospora bangkokensis TaxID=1193682 RepID=A0A1Q9LEN5_9PSEU|nr:DUF1707 domain-containing protein [Actinokineospora bangkokensis]OLR90491.1 hypothetical protein BJP25_28050 [Actinokineospora bangkokensis]